MVKSQDLRYGRKKAEKMRYVGTDAKGISEGPPVMTSQEGTEVRYGQTRQTSSSQGLWQISFIFICNGISYN